MEQLDTKIKFYQRRSFGEKLNATFDFIKQNWRPLLKYTTYFVLPLCFIQAFLFNKTMSFIMATAMATTSMYVPGATDLTYYYLSMFVNAIGGMLLISPVYAMMQYYNNNPGGLSNVDFNDLKPYVLRNLGKYLLAMVAVLVIFIAFGMLVGLLVLATQNVGVLFFCYILMIAIYVPLTLILPIIIFEKISLWNAFKKTMRLGFATWRGIFAICFVMGILYMILAGIVMLPLMVVYIVNALMLSSDVTAMAETSAFYNIGVYLLAIISTYGIYVFMILPVIGVAYQYAHANEKLNSISVVDEIDNFENF